ncbi:MAG: Wzz/FepE/Etk N-terminal domain-containing protein [Gammaproteobacteria bacterium]
MNRLPQSMHVEGSPTRERGLSDYLSIVRRRKKAIVSAIALISLLGVGIAWGLPPVYSSSATILNEQQEIPQDLVRSTVTSYAFERIEVIKQKLMTRQNLRNIVEKYKLSKDDAAKLRDAIIIEVIDAKVIDPDGRQSVVSLAFKLSYENRSAQLAYDVARELVSIFLTENRRSIETSVKETSAFLRSEAEKLGLQISAYEKKLAEFKEKNAGKLPELVDLNMQLMHRTEAEMENVLRQTQALMERRVYLQSELAQIDPYGPVYSVTGGQVLSPAGRLKALQTELLSVSARYSSDHPDVIRLRKEIDGLRKETGVAGDTGDLAARLEATRSELSAVRQKYSKDHPDVRRLVQTAQRIENELSKAPTAIALRSNPAPDNPVYIQLQTQLRASEVELASQQARGAELRRKHAEYEQRLTQTPQIEREYKTLTRDYEAALEKYRDVSAKQMQAQLSQTLESEKKGQRFIVIEPPVLPGSPAKPNRLGIAFIGFIVSIFGGIGSAAMAEARDTSIHGREGVISLFGVPPLAVIPYIDTQREIIRKQRSRYVALGVIGAVGAVFLTAHLFIMPLGDLWASLLETIGMGNGVKG